APGSAEKALREGYEGGEGYEGTHEGADEGDPDAYASRYQDLRERRARSFVVFASFVTLPFTNGRRCQRRRDGPQGGSLTSDAAADQEAGRHRQGTDAA